MLLTLAAAVLLLVNAQGADFCSASDADLLARYQQLRTVALDPERSAVIEQFILKKDAAVFTLKSGRLYLFSPTAGAVAGAVFVGDGSLKIEPADPVEQAQLKRFTDGKIFVEEKFKEAVLTFTDGTWSELSAGLKFTPGPVPSQANSALEDFRDSFRDKLKTNQEARILAGLCSPSRGQFLAAIRGQEYGRMLFTVDPLMGEEVQLVRYNNALEYYDRMLSFRSAGSVPIDQRALVDTTLTTIDAAIDKGAKLSGSAEVEFAPLKDDLRVLYVHLAAPLRISKATLNGTECKFIQEDKKKDADVWLIAPATLKRGEKAILKVEYAGDDVIQKEGDGNFFVGARTSWYPRLDNPSDLFSDRSMYRMTFRAPKDFTVVATGKLKSQRTEGKIAITEWETEIPYTVAGFNYGKYKTKTAADGGTDVAVHANSGLGDDLKSLQMAIEMNPAAARELGISSGAFSTTGLMDQSVAQTINALRLFKHYFGPLPYSRVAVTQQPAGYFGQSWPTLVFMPYTAFLDGTTKHQLGLTRDRGSTRFLEEVGPHELAHQWWGHVVGWRDYHDQWLSEGFAEYSAGLYTHQFLGVQKFKAYLNGVREEILAPLEGSSMRANDAGPIWLGSRLSSDKTKGAYQLVYAKGAFVLHMLRMLTFDFRNNDDSRFIAMMRDYVATYKDKDPSTENFKRVCDKHFNQDMGWFFKQWVYGSGIPKVKITYGLAEAGGKTKLSGEMKVEGVPADFLTVVPVLVKFKSGAVGVARLSARGQAPFNVELPEKPAEVEFNPLYALLCELDVKAL